MKKFLLVSSLVLSVFAFGQTGKMMKAGRQFGLNYPASYVKTFNLNEDALLQMSNVASEKYSLVIQDEKAGLEYFKLAFENVGEATTFFTKGIIENLKNVKKSEVKMRKIGNYNAAELLIEATDLNEETNEELNLFYVFTLIESPEFYYQVMSWTLAENKSKFEQEFRTIANSFQEF